MFHSCRHATTTGLQLSSAPVEQKILAKIWCIPCARSNWTDRVIQLTGEMAAVLFAATHLPWLLGLRSMELVVKVIVTEFCWSGLAEYVVALEGVQSQLSG